MYQPPSRPLHPEKLHLSPRSIWLRLLIACAFAILAPPTFALVGNGVALSHSALLALSALPPLPLAIWAFAARAYPRRAATSAAILTATALATAGSCFVGFMLAFLVRLLSYTQAGA